MRRRQSVTTFSVTFVNEFEDYTVSEQALNDPSFYDDLIAFNAKMAEVGFVRPQHRGILIVAETLDDLLARMAAYEPHQTIFRMTAEDL